MTLLITLLIYLAVIAIIWWIVQAIPLPPPFRIIAYVIVGIVAIIMLLSFLPGHHLSLA